MSACGKVGAWKEASHIEDMMDVNAKNYESSISVLDELIGGNNSSSVSSGSSNSYFWYFEGLDKFGSGKQTWWKIGDLKLLNPADNSDGGIGEIAIGIRSHRNPRRYGQTLLFLDRTGNKLGFALIKQKKVSA